MIEAMFDLVTCRVHVRLMLLALLSLNGAAAARATEPGQWTAGQDHRNMMDQLGIRALRPGPSGNEQDPNHANIVYARANPFPQWPDVLTLKNGRRVTTAEDWWKLRRPEIVEEFEREVYGRIPARVPKVSWSVASTQQITVAGVAGIERELVGHVDNSACPSITVDIRLTLVTPAHTVRPAPVMILFGSQAFMKRMAGMMERHPEMQARMKEMMGTDAPATEQLIYDGWGYAYLDTDSVQADNGASLRRGIIGLVNQGQPRKPDDWGALRAWGWGASRALDYLETDPSVNAKQVGIEGVSRYGKAALLTMAFDPRFAVALIGSSGEGGAKPHRRNFGEVVENLTGPGQYHWMAGNFLKYGASDASFGSRNAGDLPVDAHELIALCAPRPTFISYGSPEHGDARWLDQQGSYMATVAAGRIYRLLGAKDLGAGDDWQHATMPPVNHGLLDGALAWRQHDAGHTDGPNWRYFLPWADRFLGRDSRALPPPADHPMPRADHNSRLAHEQLLAKARAGGIDVYFEGDSITRRWGALDRPDLLANWNRNFHGWNAADFGWGGDTTQNILWRLNNGELDGVNPRVIVLLAGTNNVDAPAPPGSDDAKVADITRGLQAIIATLRAKAPRAVIVVTAIFPRFDHPALMPLIDKINRNLAQLADGSAVRFVNINDQLTAPDGSLRAGMLDADKLHPALAGYQLWADALKPIFTEILGPPAPTDHAPAPTGDPAARR
jgi:lysophospholipase L1-like esterase